MHRRKLQNNKKAQNQNQIPKKPRAAVTKQQFYSSFPLQAVSRPPQGHFGHSTGLGKCSSSWQQGSRGTAPPGSCETTLSLVQNLTDLVHLVLQTRGRAGSQTKRCFLAPAGGDRPLTDPSSALTNHFLKAPSSSLPLSKILPADSSLLTCSRGL